MKGKTENDLVKEGGLKETYTVRPAAILSSQPGTNRPWFERAFHPVMQVMKIVKPSWVISSIGLARAMLYIVKKGHHATLFQNQDLRDLISHHHLLE